MLVVVLIGHGKSDRVTSLQVAETYDITSFLSILYWTPGLFVRLKRAQKSDCSSLTILGTQ